MNAMAWVLRRRRYANLDLLTDVGVVAGGPSERNSRQ
jgi:hypothetical protein